MKIKTKYCKKHKQTYQTFLKECPICVGEKMKPEWLREKIKIEKVKDD